MSDRSRLRLAILRMLVLSLMGTLFGRLWYLQVMAADEYRLAALENRVRPVLQAAPRGRLLDGMGRSLVRNDTSLVVTIDGSVLSRQKDKGEAVLTRLSAVTRDFKGFQTAVADFKTRIRLCGPKVKAPCWNGSPLQPVPVLTGVPQTLALRIQERQEQFPGVEASLQAVRIYPFRSAAAHALGYISPISPDELKKKEFDDYERTDLIGRSGLEQVYDRELRGRTGKKMLAVNASGRVTDVVSETPPAPGNDLVLSLDVNVQRITDYELRRGIEQRRQQLDTRGKSGYFKATSGAVVVLEAKTGRVVALSSYPTYDPSVFVGGISSAEYQALTRAGSGYPLNSRAVQGLFAPASTFKIVSTSSAVMSGQASLGGYYSCPGAVTLGSRRIRNFDSASLGSITLHTSLVKSCDTVYYRFAIDEYFGSGSRRRTGPAAENIQAMARAYGLGKETGIDLPSEQDGRIVDAAFKKRRWDQNKKYWCADVKNHPPGSFLHQLQSEKCTDGWRYTAGEHVNLSIGQGETVVTPLQLAVAYAAVANGGTIYEPRLAKAVIAPDGTLVRQIPPKARGRVPVRPEVLAYMRDALGNVTTEGTARGAFAGFPHHLLRVAGKTGTAQVFGKQDTAWFASFAPANDPKYVVLAMVEEAGTGGSVAAPIVREIYEGMYGFAGKKAALPGGQTPSTLPTVRPDGSVQPPRSAVGTPPSALPPALPTPTASSVALRRRGGTR